MLLVNINFIAAEELFTGGAGSEKWWMVWVEFLFASVFIAEIMMKLSVFSWGRYWSNGRNKIDFFISWPIFVCCLVQLAWKLDSGTNLGRYMWLIRHFRLLRVLD